MSSRIILLTGTLISLLLAGCKGGPTNEQGITLHVNDTYVDPVGRQVRPAVPRRGTEVSGVLFLLIAGQTTVGHKYAYDGFTDDHGAFFADDVVVPALWNHFVTFPSPCGTDHLV